MLDDSEAKGRLENCSFDMLVCSVVYGVMFGIVALICLVVLEVVYVVVFRSFNSEIFACVTFVIGTILGSFFVQKKEQSLISPIRKMSARFLPY